MIAERKNEMVDWCRRILNIFLLFCVLVLFVQIVWQVFILPKLRIQRVVLESDIPIGDEQLLSILDVRNKPWPLLDEDNVQAGLESLVTVREARVERVFPDTLKVWISKRQPLVLMVNDEEENLDMVFFDRDGVVIALGATELVDSLNLPVVTGVNLPEVAIGDRLPDNLRTLMYDVDEIRIGSAALYDLISEIEVIPDEVSSYYLRVYMSHVKIPLLMNRRISTSLLQEAMLVLDILGSGKMGRVSEADLRGETLVFHSGGII